MCALVLTGACAMSRVTRWIVLTGDGAMQKFRVGDFVCHTAGNTKMTVAAIRMPDGDFVCEWEDVPSQFGGKSQKGPIVPRIVHVRAGQAFFINDCPIPECYLAFPSLSSHRPPLHTNPTQQSGLAHLQKAT